MKNFKKSAAFLPVLILLVLSLRGWALAENIILEDLSGREVNLTVKNAKPAILFFWTSWCHFCRSEIKVLNQNYKEIEKAGITVLMINVGESKNRVKSFFKDYPLHFKVLLDDQGLAAEKYDVIGVPTYIFINKSGRVISSENKLPADYKNLLLK